MLTQLSLLDLPPKPIEVNSTVSPEDRKRLSAQCRKLLNALIERPRTNVEIVTDLHILNSTGRISDLRSAGCTVVGTNRGGGLWEYEMTYCPADLIHT